MSDGDETPDDETPETEDGEGAAPEGETAETDAETESETETESESVEEEDAAEATEEEATEEAATEEEVAEADTSAKNEGEGGGETDDTGESADADADADAEGDGEADAATDADGDDGTEADEPQPEDGAMEAKITGEEIDQRLDAVEEDLEAAETEAELDEVEAEIDDIEADLENADVPETLEADEDEDEDGDEDDEDGDEEETNEHSREEFESRIETLRDSLESKRGPYGEDVVSTVEEAETTITDTRWTERGESEVAEAVRAFCDEVSEILTDDVEPSGDDEASLIDALDEVIAAVEGANLDADDDADTIEALMEAADGLSEDIENAQAWDDLETREKLEAQGYYDCLGHYKDFPPEWAALKVWEKRGNVEMVLLALDSFQSDFMEEHALEAIVRMNDDGAFDEMHQRAQKRNKPAIKALGKMQAEDAVETLVEYVDADSDPALQKVTFKALGEIGDDEATQALANKLDADGDIGETVRPHAARALGILGDTRAVDPLADTLKNDENQNVRAAAAWALRQIGTQRALEAAAEYTDESSYIVQHEARKAHDDLGVESDADATSATGD